MEDSDRRPTVRLSVAEAWRAYRRDPHWVRKSLLGGLAYLIPIVGPYLVLGYLVDYERRVAWGEDQGLPPFGELQTLALRSVGVFAGMLLWGLPLSFVVLLLLGMMLGTTGLVFALGGPQHLVGAIVAAVAAGVAFLTILWVVAVLYAPVVQAATTRFALYDRIEAYFDVRDILARLRGRYWPLLWAIVRVSLIQVAIIAALSVVMIVVTTVLTLLGILFLVPGAVAASSSSALRAAFLAGGIGGFLAFTALSMFVRLAFVAALFFVTFPVQAIAFHVYGQWARDAYELPSRRDDREPANAAARSRL